MTLERGGGREEGGRDGSGCKPWTLTEVPLDFLPVQAAALQTPHHLQRSPLVLVYSEVSPVAFRGPYSQESLRRIPALLPSQDLGQGKSLAWHGGEDPKMVGWEKY